MKLVARFGSAPAAHVFQALLASEDIDSELKGEESLVYLPGSGAMNALMVFVDEKDWARARELHVSWERQRKAEAEAAEEADAAMEVPVRIARFRMVTAVYCLLAAGLGFLNVKNAGYVTESQWRAKYGDGASAGPEVWSLSYDGYPGYLICSIASGLMLFFFNRFGRPLFWLTLGWWVLASVFRVGGERLVVSWPLEVLGFLLALTVAVMAQLPEVNRWFYPTLRRQGTPPETPAPDDEASAPPPSGAGTPND